VFISQRKVARRGRANPRTARTTGTSRPSVRESFLPPDLPALLVERHEDVRDHDLVALLRQCQLLERHERVRHEAVPGLHVEGAPKLGPDTREAQLHADLAPPPDQRGEADDLPVRCHETDPPAVEEGVSFAVLVGQLADRTTCAVVLVVDREDRDAREALLRRPGRYREIDGRRPRIGHLRAYRDRLRPLPRPAQGRDLDLRLPSGDERNVTKQNDLPFPRPDERDVPAGEGLPVDLHRVCEAAPGRGQDEAQGVRIAVVLDRETARRLRRGLLPAEPDAEVGTPARLPLPREDRRVARVVGRPLVDREPVREPERERVDQVRIDAPAVCAVLDLAPGPADERAAVATGHLGEERAVPAPARTALRAGGEHARLPLVPPGLDRRDGDAVEPVLRRSADERGLRDDLPPEEGEVEVERDDVLVPLDPDP
jgi:hypothetical protein